MRLASSSCRSSSPIALQPQVTLTLTLTLALSLSLTLTLTLTLTDFKELLDAAAGRVMLVTDTSASPRRRQNSTLPTAALARAHPWTSSVTGVPLMDRQDSVALEDEAGGRAAVSYVGHRRLRARDGHFIRFDIGSCLRNRNVCGKSTVDVTSFAA